MQKFPVTVVMLGLLGLALVSSVVQEFTGNMSGLFVQLHWCSQGEYSCIVLGWAILMVVMIGIAITFDLINKKRIEDSRKEPVFRLVAHPPIEKHSDEMRWASIKIENVSSSILTQCFVTLDDALDLNGKSILKVKVKRNLLWSQGNLPRDDEKDILPGGQKVIDVAKTHPSNQITFDTQAGQETNGKGIYELIVTAHGRLDGVAQSRTERFIMEYARGNILTIINKGAEKWPNSNPKKPRVTKRKPVPPVSDRSSS